METAIVKQMNRSKNNRFAARNFDKRFGFTWTELFVCLAILVVLVALLLPVTRGGSREAARRMQCSNNLKQIGLALHNYEQQYKMLPPAYTVDADGKRMHSWRTLILPFLEQTDLYNKVDFSKAWDDPANEAVRGEIVSVYRCPANKGAAGETTYLAIVGEKNVLRPLHGRAFSEIVDGTSNTVMVYEADTTQAVHWMSPHDASEETFVSSNEKSKTVHTGGRNTCMADGSVRFIFKEISSELSQALATVDGHDQPPAEH